MISFPIVNCSIVGLYFNWQFNYTCVDHHCAKQITSTGHNPKFPFTLSCLMCLAISADSQLPINEQNHQTPTATADYEEDMEVDHKEDQDEGSHDEMDTA